MGGTKELSNGGECGFVSSDNTKLKEYLIEQLGKNKEDRQIQAKKCIEFVQKYDVKEQVKKFEELLEGL